MKPLVSVIVPIYNAAPFLTETLDSIIASTYRPIEIVMVDDGSSDDSLKIAQKYCDEAFSINENKPSQCNMIYKIIRAEEDEDV